MKGLALKQINKTARQMQKKVFWLISICVLLTGLVIVIWYLIIPDRQININLASMGETEIKWPLSVESLLKLHPHYSTYLVNEERLQALSKQPYINLAGFSVDILRSIKESLVSQDEMIRQYKMNFTAAETKFLDKEWDFFSQDGQKEYRQRVEKISAQLENELTGALKLAKEEQAKEVSENLSRLDRTYGTLILQINLNLQLCSLNEEKKTQLTAEKEQLLKEWTDKRKLYLLKLSNQTDLQIRQYASKYQGNLEKEKKNLVSEINQIVSSSYSMANKKSSERIEKQNSIAENTRREGKNSTSEFKERTDSSMEKVILTLRENQAKMYRQMLNDLAKEIRKYGFQKIKNKIAN